MKWLTLGKLFALITLTALSFSYTYRTKSQSTDFLTCGDIFEGETTKTEERFIGEAYPSKRYGDSFTLDIPAGTFLNIVVTPMGATFNVAFAFLDSDNNPISVVNKGIEGKSESLDNFQLGSSRQQLVIIGVNPGFDTDDKDDFGFYGVIRSGGLGMFFGAYEIRLGCTLRDGTVIEPGESATASTSGNGTSSTTNALPTFSGNGFPGLAPVDFSAVAKIPMIANVPMTGGVAPDGSTILGYTVDAAANDTLALGFTRLSGNLNLGLVVLSADNKVVFQASLVTSSELTTKFTVPADGTYTIGVFRIDLLPPDAPEATAFQLTAALNP